MVIERKLKVKKKCAETQMREGKGFLKRFYIVN